MTPSKVPAGYTRGRALGSAGASVTGAEGGRRKTGKGRDGGQEVGCLDRPVPQVPDTELRRVGWAGEEVMRGVRVLTATEGT